MSNDTEHIVKVNLDVTIPEVVEQYTYGTVTFNSIRLECLRSCDAVYIQQQDKLLCMTEDQAQQLYLHLKQVFDVRSEKLGE